MHQLVGRLWQDDQGALIATEWVFVATILVIGSITGLVAVRQAILEELEDLAEAISHLSTFWRFDGDGDDDDHHDKGKHKGWWHSHHHQGDGDDDFNCRIQSVPPSSVVTLTGSACN